MTTTTVTLSSPGTATIVDTTAEAVLSLQTSLEGIFVEVNTNLAGITTEINLLTNALATFNTSFETALGTLGMATPGTLSNSAMVAKDVLSILAETQIQIQENVNDVTSSISLLQFSMAGVGAAVQEGVAVQTFAAADTLKKNAFEIAATKEALQRADLPEPQPPSFRDSAEESVRNAVQLNTAASATAYVETSITTGLTRATTFASEQVVASQAGQYVGTKWTTFKNWLFGEKAVEKTRNTTLKAGLTAARAGTKPTV